MYLALHEWVHDPFQNRIDYQASQRSRSSITNLNLGNKRTQNSKYSKVTLNTKCGICPNCMGTWPNSKTDWLPSTSEIKVIRGACNFFLLLRYLDISGPQGIQFYLDTDISSFIWPVGHPDISQNIQIDMCGTMIVTESYAFLAVNRNTKDPNGVKKQK